MQHLMTNQPLAPHLGLSNTKLAVVPFFHAKIYTTVTSKQDQEDLQKDLDNLCQWSSDWLLKFNIQKCKVVSYGNVSYQYNYVMNENTGGASALSSED